MSIPQFSAGTSAGDIAEALGEAGCAVVTGVMDAGLRQSIAGELAPHMAKARLIEEDDPTKFYPRPHAARLCLGRAFSQHHRPARAAPVEAGGSATPTLLPNCEHGYQLHVSAAVEVGPGAREQVLHREESSFTFFPLPRPNIIVASMWAVTEFRADNGGTLLVPGSHKWPADRKARPDEILSAEMPAGAVLFWMGGTLHGAGANTSRDWRYGVILTYSLGWVRQEENQYLDVPRERMAELSPEVRRLLGFDMYAALGFYDPRVA